MEYRINKDEKVYPFGAFTYGREDEHTFVEVIPSTYSNKQSNEVQIKIVQNHKEIVLAEETLRQMALWFSMVTLPAEKADKD